MTDRLPETVTNENWRAAIDSDRTVRITRMVGGMITTALLVLILSITFSCTRPDVARPVDQEAQAARMTETVRMQSCVRSGGAWMPVVVRTNRGRDESPMSCVTKDAIPLAREMNDGRTEDAKANGDSTSGDVPALVQ